MLYEKESVFDALSYECLSYLDDVLDSHEVSPSFYEFHRVIRKEILQAMRRKVMRTASATKRNVDLEFLEKELTKL